MRGSLATTILEAQDLEVVSEVVPEWKDQDGNPVTVFIHQLNAEDSIAWTRSMDTVDRANDGMFIICIFTFKDGPDPHTAKNLFTMDDLPELKKKSFLVFNRLQRIALQLNRADKASEVALKKDLSEAPTGASPIA